MALFLGPGPLGIWYGSDENPLTVYGGCMIRNMRGTRPVS